MAGLGSRRSRSIFATLIAAGCLNVVPSARAQHTVSGVPGVATSRAIVNFKSLAALEASGILTNLTPRGVAQPRPMPEKEALDSQQRVATDFSLPHREAASLPRRPRLVSKPCRMITLPSRLTLMARSVRTMS